MITTVIFDMYETLITQYASPLYFGAQISADMGISEENFYRLRDPLDEACATGQLTFEDMIAQILNEYGIYSDELLKKISDKRSAAKRECFRHLHSQIIPMLEELKSRKLKIGLISNCFSEEIPAIRESEIFPYFDAVCLSYEEGVRKPNKEIYMRCIDRLSVEASECLYVGDGGSHELEAARELGMTALQAVWYLNLKEPWQTSRKEDFIQLESPMDLFNFLSSYTQNHSVHII
ncbi:MAG: HAD-IA family hydrolase [Lachnospiraceae bacterium]|nr:HAD-IA family hydrolase [Lachnospiraceae bacterium]